MLGQLTGAMNKLLTLLDFILSILVLALILGIFLNLLKLTSILILGIFLNLLKLTSILILVLLEYFSIYSNLLRS